VYRAHHHFAKGWKHFWKTIGKVLRDPIFLALTLIGNGILIVCSVLFYVFEQGTNPNVITGFDAAYWTIVTITTVGYGDVAPVTVVGKIVSMIMMLTSGVLFFSVIALVASSFVEREFEVLEAEIKELRVEIKKLLERQQ